MIVGPLGHFPTPLHTTIQQSRQRRLIGTERNGTYSLNTFCLIAQVASPLTELRLLYGLSATTLTSYQSMSRLRDIIVLPPVWENGYLSVCFGGTQVFRASRHKRSHNGIDCVYTSRQRQGQMWVCWIQLTPLTQFGPRKILSAVVGGGGFTPQHTQY